MSEISWLLVPQASKIPSRPCKPNSDVFIFLRKLAVLDRKLNFSIPIKRFSFCRASRVAKNAVSIVRRMFCKMYSFLSLSQGDSFRKISIWKLVLTDSTDKEKWWDFKVQNVSKTMFFYHRRISRSNIAFIKDVWHACNPFSKYPRIGIISVFSFATEALRHKAFCTFSQSSSLVTASTFKHFAPRSWQVLIKHKNMHMLQLYLSWWEFAGLCRNPVLPKKFAI